MQMPLIAVQNSIAPKFVPVAMALVTFGQTFGGAVFLAIAETILSNQLRLNIPKYAPSVSAASIIAAGGSGPAVRAAVGDNPAGLIGTLVAYSKSIDAVYWFAAGAAGLMFFVSFGMGWKDIRKKEKPLAVPAQSGGTDIEKGETAPPPVTPEEIAANAETELSTSHHAKEVPLEKV